MLYELRMVFEETSARCLCAFHEMCRRELDQSRIHAKVVKLLGNVQAACGTHSLRLSGHKGWGIFRWPSKHSRGPCVTVARWCSWCRELENIPSSGLVLDPKGEGEREECALKSELEREG
jgi:hypothetical protein